jgi:NAD-dependent DNA ligase
LIHFCSKEAMDIQWVGDAIVDILMQQHLIHSVADIYKLSEIQTQIFLKKIPWIWEKMLYEIAQQLEESKHKELWRKLNALWIPNIWKKTAQDIEKFLQEKWAKNLSEIEELLTNEELMLQIDWIWEKTIIALKEFFANKQVKAMLEKLEWFGMQFNASNSEPHPTPLLIGEGKHEVLGEVKIWEKLSTWWISPISDLDFFISKYTVNIAPRSLIQSHFEKEISNIEIWLPIFKIVEDKKQNSKKLIPLVWIAQTFGHLATKNVVEITDEQLKSVMEKRDLNDDRLKNFEWEFVILKWNWNGVWLVSVQNWVWKNKCF